MSGHTISEVLARQHRTAWSLLQLHLDSLTTDDLFREPVAGAITVQRVDGRWIPWWPEQEADETRHPPPTIAWLTWHIGFWWSMALDHSFGAGTLSRHDVAWPGTAEGVRDWLDALHTEWLAALDSLDEPDFARTERCRWPFRDRPFADLAAWLNVELMKNAAEIGYVRALLRAGPPIDAPDP